MPENYTDMDLEEIFSVSGRLAMAAMCSDATDAALRNYESRPQQIEMAHAVERAIASQRHLLVEAGTGVGKSLAYLVPLIKWAVSEDRKIVISTYTKTLQEQLTRKDLPFLHDTLGLDFNYALCLGGGNYLCRRRLSGCYAHDLFDSHKEARDVAKINSWCEATETGLRSELEFMPSEAVWGKVCREGDLCMGKKCRYRSDCFYNKARVEQQAAQVLVVNHHLYFANLVSGGNVLPAFDAVLFDEAHTLEDVATSYMGMEVSNFGIERFFDSIFSARSGKGLLVKALKRDAAKAMDAREILENARKAAKAFFSDLAGRFGDAAGVERVRESGFVHNHLKEHICGLCASLKSVLDGTEDDEERIELKSAIVRGESINASMEAMINMDLEGHVYWVSVEPRPRSVRYGLSAAPIDIAGQFRAKVLETVNFCVFTSASLSINGDFSFIMDRLGITDADKLSVDSPFNYRKQALLYIPEGIPDPNAEFDAYEAAVIEQIKELLGVTRGRTFVLFTSYKMLRRAYDALIAENAGLLILQQEEAPRYTLLERFKKEEGVVLLGTATFWQGIDVPGRDLECVIITKLPFSVPDAPVIGAKIESLRAHHRNPFTEYQLPQAIMMFRQGFGRLIRTKMDNGMVAVLDPRIKTRYYGKKFISAVPECKRASTIKEVEDFFEKSCPDNIVAG